MDSNHRKHLDYSNDIVQPPQYVEVSKEDVIRSQKDDDEKKTKTNVIDLESICSRVKSKYNVKIYNIKERHKINMEELKRRHAMEISMLEKRQQEELNENYKEINNEISYFLNSISNTDKNKGIIQWLISWIM